MNTDGFFRREGEVPSEPMRLLRCGRAKFHLSRTGFRLGRSRALPLWVCGLAGAAPSRCGFSAWQEPRPPVVGLWLGRSRALPLWVFGLAGAASSRCGFAAWREPCFPKVLSAFRDGFHFLQTELSDVQRILGPQVFAEQFQRQPAIVAD